MNSKEINSVAETIYSDLYSKENEDLSREKIINLIVSRLMPLVDDARKLGKNQVINYIQDNLNYLKPD